MMDILNSYQFWAILLVVIAIVYKMVVKPRLVETNVLTQEQLDFIDYAVEQSVIEAEKLYDANSDDDIKEIAFRYAFNLIEESGMIPKEYLLVVRAMIEDKIVVKRTML